jgi:hypothetical protein
MEAYYRGGRIRFTELETDQKDRPATSATCPVVVRKAKPDHP